MKILSDTQSLDRVLDGVNRKLPTKTSDLINDTNLVSSESFSTAPSAQLPKRILKDANLQPFVPYVEITGGGSVVYLVTWDDED